MFPGFHTAKGQFCSLLLSNIILATSLSFNSHLHHFKYPCSPRNTVTQPFHPAPDSSMHSHYNEISLLEYSLRYAYHLPWHGSKQPLRLLVIPFSLFCQVNDGVWSYQTILYIGLILSVHNILYSKFFVNSFCLKLTIFFVFIEIFLQEYKKQPASYSRLLHTCYVSGSLSLSRLLKY